MRVLIYWPEKCAVSVEHNVVFNESDIYMTDIIVMVLGDTQVERKINEIIQAPEPVQQWIPDNKPLFNHAPAHPEPPHQPGPRECDVTPDNSLPTDEPHMIMEIVLESHQVFIAPCVKDIQWLQHKPTTLMTF